MHLSRIQITLIPYTYKQHCLFAPQMCAACLVGIRTDEKSPRSYRGTSTLNLRTMTWMSCWGYGPAVKGSRGRDHEVHMERSRRLPWRWYQEIPHKGKICFHLLFWKNMKELFGKLTPLAAIRILHRNWLATVNLMFFETGMLMKLERDIPPRRCFTGNTPWNCVINSTTEGAAEFVYCQSEDWVTSGSLILSWFKSSFF